MYRKLLILTVMLILPGLLLAQVGKIAGKVVDRETKEPLIGANVIIEGTTLGASTDINGNYVILNVPPGIYTLKASYVGYQTITIRNVRVTVGLTTEVNFELPSEAIQVPTVEVVAERPLVQKNATNEIRVVRAEDVQNMPLRGYTSVVAIQTGVVQVGGTIYVRGGRSEEVAYFVDGVYFNNPYNYARTGEVVTTAIEEVSYQAGGFNAEYGYAMSGVVVTTTKTGGSRYSATLEMITDEYGGFFRSKETGNPNFHKKNALTGAYSQGYSLYSLSLGGPVLPGFDKIRFFFALERTFMRNRRPSFYNGVQATVVEGKDTFNINIPAGILRGNSTSRWLFNGNVVFDFKPFNLRIGGTSFFRTDREYIHSYSAFNYNRMPRTEETTHGYYAKLTHTISPRTFYTLMFSWYRTFTESGDHFWWDDIESYGDKNKNPQLRDWGRNQPFRPFSLFAQENTVYPNYSKNLSSYWGLKFDILHQIGRVHEIKAGFDFRYNTIRVYGLRALDIAQNRRTNPTGSNENIYQTAFVNTLGYDVTGKTEVNTGRNGAKHPIVGAAYIQDKIELPELILNLGLRVDYINPNTDQLVDPTNIILESKGDWYDFADANFKSSKPYYIFAPRLGISFPVTDRTVFHAQYGVFSQAPQLNLFYTSTILFAQYIRSGNYIRAGNPNLRPPKTIAYEVGFAQQITRNASFDITAYYKETRDLIQIQNILARPTAYAMYVNGDYGTIKGLSFSFTLRRTNRVAAFINYTLQYAAGTGSAATTNFNIAWLGGNFPTFVAPLDFDQRHTGSINVDFRTEKGDGPTVFGIKPFEYFGVNLLFRFGSGLPYTPVQYRSYIYGPGWQIPTAAVNSGYGPWTSQLDLKIDRAIRFGRVSFDIYLWVINLFDSKNVINVYNSTGLPDADGWFRTPEGMAWAESNGPEAVKLYNYMLAHPYNWGEPRQVRLGLRIDL